MTDMKQDGWNIDGQLARETNEILICHRDVSNYGEHESYSRSVAVDYWICFE